MFAFYCSLILSSVDTLANLRLDCLPPVIFMRVLHNKKIHSLSFINNANTFVGGTQSTLKYTQGTK